MRNNHEGATASNIRYFGARLGTMNRVLTSDFIFPDSPEAAVTFFLDPNGSNKNIYLPPLTAARGERWLVIANTGLLGSLLTFDSLGASLSSIPVGAMGLFFAGSSSWRWIIAFDQAVDSTGMLTELRRVTAAGAQVVNATEPGLMIDKAVASPTAITLPAVATRNGKPVRLVDWRGNVDATNPVTVTGTGGEKIHNLASWQFNSLMGGATLFPNTVVGGWTIRA